MGEQLTIYDALPFGLFCDTCHGVDEHAKDCELLRDRMAWLDEYKA